MKDRKKYYKLDEIGFVGTQEKEPFKKGHTAKKTGEIFHAARKAAKGLRRRKPS